MVLTHFPLLGVGQVAKTTLNSFHSYLCTKGKLWFTIAVCVQQKLLS